MGKVGRGCPISGWHGVYTGSRKGGIAGAARMGGFSSTLILSPGRRPAIRMPSPSWSRGTGASWSCTATASSARPRTLRTPSRRPSSPPGSTSPGSKSGHRYARGYIGSRPTAALTLSAPLADVSPRKSLCRQAPPLPRAERHQQRDMAGALPRSSPGGDGGRRTRTRCPRRGTRGHLIGVRGCPPAASSAPAGRPHSAGRPGLPGQRGRGDARHC